jgi:DNA-binding GntR family transcriptional regulator
MYHIPIEDKVCECMYQTKQEIAYKYIKDSIISGVYKPGSRLVLSDLEDEINISNMPIREALRRLQSEGWVRSIAHKGVIISEISLKDAEQNYGVRKVLEIYAAKDICRNISPGVIEKLKRLYEKMAESLSDPLKFRELNYAFHFTIFEESRNNTLFRVMQSLWDEGLRFQSTFYWFPERAIMSNEEHDLIIKALENKDLIEYKNISIKHTDRAINYVKELIKDSARDASRLLVHQT